MSAPTLARGVLVLTADELADRARWLATRAEGIGASEIAAVLGICPPDWDSPFSLYWRKKLRTEVAPSEQMEWGLRHEPAIAAKFAENHPEFQVRPAGMYRNPTHQWMLATPDRILQRVDGGPDELCQIKTSYSWDCFGEPGTGDIPVYYRAQVMQEMLVYGAARCWVPVLVGGNSYREYVVDFDPVDADTIRAAGQQFMDRLAADTPPDLDGSAATTRALKALHPSVVDEPVTVPTSLADLWWQRRQILDDAQTAYDEATNRLRAAMGDHRTAVADGRRVAYRSVYESTRVSGKRLKAEHPDIYADYATTSATDKIIPAKESQ